MRADHDVITFYLAGYSFYPAAIKRALKADDNYEPGLYRIISRKRYFGSQALLLKREFALRLLSEWNNGPLDRQVGMTDDMWAYVPNPVQHYGARFKSTWSSRGQPHYSRSYRDE